MIKELPKGLPLVVTEMELVAGAMVELEEVQDWLLESMEGQNWVEVGHDTMDSNQIVGLDETFRGYPVGRNLAVVDSNPEDHILGFMNDARSWKSLCG